MASECGSHLDRAMIGPLVPNGDNTDVLTAFLFQISSQNLIETHQLPISMLQFLVSGVDNLGFVIA